jgi:nitroreductase
MAEIDGTPNQSYSDAQEFAMTSATQSIVDSVMDSRYSCRAFLPDPVPQALVAEILAIASRAPSGTNIQPWKVWVLTGDTQKRVSNSLLAAFDDPEEAATHSDPYQYYLYRHQSNTEGR